MVCEYENGAPAAHGLSLEWHDNRLPFAPRFNDHYYSRSDGRAECAHVFLAGNNLPERFRTHESLRTHESCRTDGRFVIGELGFGTGLNLAETWRVWKAARLPGCNLHFISIEAFPLSHKDMAHALSAWPLLAAEATALSEAIARAGVKRSEKAPALRLDIALDTQTHLTLLLGQADVAIRLIDQPVDAWYLDGFAPSRNPAMWEAALLRDVFCHTRTGGTFATYTAAGWVRRNLAAAGFTVSKRRGFAGKRDMTIGRAISKHVT